MKVIIYSDKVHGNRLEELAKLSQLEYSIGEAKTSLGDKQGIIINLIDEVNDVLRITRHCTIDEKMNIGMMPIEE